MLTAVFIITSKERQHSMIISSLGSAAGHRTMSWQSMARWLACWCISLGSKHSRDQACGMTSVLHGGVNSIQQFSGAYF